MSEENYVEVQREDGTSNALFMILFILKVKSMRC